MSSLLQIIVFLPIEHLPGQIFLFFFSLPFTDSLFTFSYLSSFHTAPSAAPFICFEAPHPKCFGSKDEICFDYRTFNTH